MIKTLFFVSAYCILVGCAGNKEGINNTKIDKTIFPIVFNMRAGNIVDGYTVSPDEIKSIQKYFKVKKVELITEDDLGLRVQEKIADIFEPYIKTGTMDKNKEEVQRKILNMDNVAKRLTYILYGTDINIDSIRIETSYIPGTSTSKREGTRKIFLNESVKPPVEFIKTILDSCLASNYLR